jgi:hypothetical protein
MASEFSISHSIGIDTTLPPKLDLYAGANSHIFQPPRTPSASSSLYQSTASTASGFQSGTTSRKRSRHDFYSPNRIANYPTDDNAWSPSASEQSSMLLTPGLMSPAPLVNTQYILAAGFETPTATTASILDRSETYTASPDHACRAGRGWDDGGGIDSDSYFPQQLFALGREVNGRPRVPKGQPPREGWGKAVQSVVGVAGRLWNFCTMNAFQGFYAGGGQGFHMDSPKLPLAVERNIYEEMEDKRNVYRSQREPSSIPGCFPEEDFIPEYMSQTHTTPERPAKKLRREKCVGDLRANWVMVGRFSNSKESSPTRVSARKVPPVNTSGGRASSRGSKRPILSASKPSQTSCAGSPALRPDRSASFASSRSPLTTAKHGSPISVEAQKHAVRMRRREAEEDAHLKRFNQQLKAMIKEGKEALGTKIVVEDEVDDMTDEGYGEGDCFDNIVK